MSSSSSTSTRTKSYRQSTPWASSMEIDPHSTPNGSFVGGEPVSPPREVYDGVTRITSPSSSERVVESPILERAPDYAKMSISSATPPPSDVGITTYMSRVVKMVKKIHKMGWVLGSGRVTVDYYPGKQELSDREEDLYERRMRGHITSISWKSQKYIEWRRIPVSPPPSALPPPFFPPPPSSFMNLCDRCSRSLDRQQRDIPFKSITDEIVFIQSQVRRVEHEIERLTSRRVTLQRRLNAIAASTVTLPFEIISHIFQHACPPLDVASTTEAGVVGIDADAGANGNGSANAGLGAKDGGVTYPIMPFKLAAVCSQWREIALSTPQLWTSIAFTLYQSRNVSNARALDAFFNRSGSCQLTISFIFASADEGRDRLENDVPPSYDVLRVFVKHSGRWGTLKIDGLPPEWIPMLKQAKNATPEIKQVWLCPYDNSREQQMVDMFGDAPELRRVTLDNTFLSAIILPWAGLTHLKVSWVSIDECAEMLRRCPVLLECDFQRILSNAEFHPLPQSNPNESPIVLKFLHTLRWSYAGDAWEFQLFERIQFPALKHLKLKLRYDLAHFSFIERILRKMLGETSRGVERVDLDLGCPWVNVYEILKGGDGVREVRLVDEHDPESVRMLMAALVGSTTAAITNIAGQIEGKERESMVFLPRLRSLEFQGINPTDSAFARMVVEQLKRRWDIDTRDMGPPACQLVSLPELSLDHRGVSYTNWNATPTAVSGGERGSGHVRGEGYGYGYTPSGRTFGSLYARPPSPYLLPPPPLPPPPPPPPYFSSSPSSSTSSLPLPQQPSSSLSSPLPIRSRLEQVILEFSSEVFIDGIGGHGAVVREGLKELGKAGMKVKIINGFEGRGGWLGSSSVSTSAPVPVSALVSLSAVMGGS